jgi:RNA polymerase sigma-70 factor, ECF subfamily
MPEEDENETAALARLARASTAGDREAEQRLCARLYPRVRAWSLVRLRDRSAAADLAQQTLLVVVEALRAGKVESIERILPFVHGACKNTLMAWRRGDRRRAALLETFGPSFASEVTLEDRALDRRRVAECFEKLPERAQTILSLTFYAESTAEAIAGELTVSEENVRVLRHRALRRLRDCVNGGEET